MHQDFDKIIKESLRKALQPIFTKVCGIQVTDITNIPKSLPRTIVRRTDLLKIGTDVLTGERKLYHIEFQAANHPTMENRMLTYFALLNEMYKLPVDQYVIYIGDGLPTMETQFISKNISFEYKLISINTIDYQVFINSEYPEEMILAILGKFDKKDKTEVIQNILTCLNNKVKNKRNLQKYIFQLEILSNLRNLQTEVTTQTDNMSIYYDLETDVRYKQGVGVGIEQGVAQGIEQGIEQGAEVTKRNLTIKHLRKNVYSVVEIADFVDMPLEYVLAIQKEIATE
jgi:predicted transposase/invertase (TIGR01784 family)